jgi:hypothetical protein
LCIRLTLLRLPCCQLSASQSVRRAAPASARGIAKLTYLRRRVSRVAAMAAVAAVYCSKGLRPANMGRPSGVLAHLKRLQATSQPLPCYPRSRRRAEVLGPASMTGLSFKQNRLKLAPLGLSLAAGETTTEISTKGMGHICLMAESGRPSFLRRTNRLTRLVFQGGTQCDGMDLARPLPTLSCCCS